MAIHIGQGETVQLHTYSPGPPNSHGKPSASYTTSEVSGVGVDVPSVDMIGAETSDQESISAVIFLPKGMTCAKQDQFTVRGLRYQVDGEAPMVIKNFFTGALFPTPVKLKRVTG